MIVMMRMEASNNQITISAVVAQYMYSFTLLNFHFKRMQDKQRTFILYRTKSLDAHTRILSRGLDG